MSISIDDVLSTPTMFELVEAFCGVCTGSDGKGPATRLRLRNDVLTGTWETLVTGQVDLAIGVPGHLGGSASVEVRPLGSLDFVFCVAPHHALSSVQEPIDHDQLVHHRAVAVADTAQRLAPLTVNLLPGQDVLTVPTMRAKLEALLRGLGCGYVPEPLARPHLEAGHLVPRQTDRGPPTAQLFYAWRAERGAAGLGRALQWWLGQLASPMTRRALLERHAGPLS